MTFFSSFRLGGLFSDRPIYKHEEREEFLFYLTSRNRGLWMVGPSVGQFNGGLANRGDPVSAQKYEWGWNIWLTSVIPRCVPKTPQQANGSTQTDNPGIATQASRSLVLSKSCRSVFTTTRPTLRAATSLRRWEEEGWSLVLHPLPSASPSVRQERLVGIGPGPGSQEPTAT